jgi:hypothetical protein
MDIKKFEVILALKGLVVYRDIYFNTGYFARIEESNGEITEKVTTHEFAKWRYYVKGNSLNEVNEQLMVMWQKDN